MDGSNSYSLKFALLPLVEAFWLPTMYDAKTKLFVDNKSDRCSVGDRTAGIKTAKDGSLTITISATEPSDVNAKANWLPAPKGQFRFTARFYGPDLSIIDGSYKMPEPAKVK